MSLSMHITSLVHSRGRSRARGRNPNAGAPQRRRYVLRSSMLLVRTDEVIE
jgi:hypothetical protein